MCVSGSAAQHERARRALRSCCAVPGIRNRLNYSWTGFALDKGSRHDRNIAPMPVLDLFRLAAARVEPIRRHASPAFEAWLATDMEREYVIHAGPSVSELPMSNNSNTIPTGDQSGNIPTPDLTLYELQKPFVEPMLRMCRFTNTALDVLFYDVGKFSAAMLARGSTIDTRECSNSAQVSKPPLEHLDLSAITNPEGSILVIDADAPPYVTR